MLRLSNFEKGNRLLDIGAGDGRVLIRALEWGAEYVEGWELQEEVYNMAKAHVEAALSSEDRLKYQSRIHLVCGDGLNATFCEFDVIVLYLLPAGLELLRPVLEAAATAIEGSASTLDNEASFRVVTQGWPIPGWKCTSTLITTGGSTIYLYDCRTSCFL
jgi:SAM-dependent methyltransferase